MCVLSTCQFEIAGSARAFLVKRFVLSLVQPYQFTSLFVSCGPFLGSTPLLTDVNINQAQSRSTLLQCT